MSVSSRTPEGEPLRCRICGQDADLEVSQAGDAVCPSCGSLLWRFRSLIADQLNLVPDQITAASAFVNDLGMDSLDTVELIMLLEEEFDVTLPKSDAEMIYTVADAIRYIKRLRDL